MGPRVVRESRDTGRTDHHPHSNSSVQIQVQVFPSTRNNHDLQRLVWDAISKYRRFREITLILLNEIICSSGFHFHYGLTASMTWISLYNHGFLGDIITHPCPSFNVGLTKPEWQLRHGRMIPSHPFMTLQWRHNGPDCVSNRQPHHCLLNRLFGRRSNIKALRRWPLCGGFTGDRWIPGTNDQ